MFKYILVNPFCSYETKFIYTFCTEKMYKQSVYIYTWKKIQLKETVLKYETKSYPIPAIFAFFCIKHDCFQACAFFLKTLSDCFNKQNIVIKDVSINQRLINTCYKWQKACSCSKGRSYFPFKKMIRKMPMYDWFWLNYKISITSDIINCHWVQINH